MNREAKIAEKVTARSLTANPFYLKQLEGALNVFAYTPFENAWDDPRMQRRIEEERKEIEKRIQEIISQLPMPVTYMVVGLGGKTLEFNDENELVETMKLHGIRATGRANSRSLRKELQGRLLFDSLLGPMYGGAKRVRYETQEAYDQLSQ
jgi:hypothetical protein